MSTENTQLCRCCNQPATWLITGYSPEGRYEDEPACDVAKSYVGQCAAECHCEFSAVRITPGSTTTQSTCTCTAGIRPGPTCAMFATGGAGLREEPTGWRSLPSSYEYYGRMKRMTETISNQTCCKCQSCGEMTNHASDPHFKALLAERNDLAEQVKEMQDLAIWMTGCGYDFLQHEYFREKRVLLFSGSPDDRKEVEG